MPAANEPVRFAAAARREGGSGFDGATRLSEAGAIQAAIVRAREELGAVLARPGLTPAMKSWAEHVLKELGPAK